MTWHEDTLAVLQEVVDPDVTGDPGFGPYAVTVPPDRWRESLTALRDQQRCTFFDWLSAVDELEDGFRVVCHVAALRPTGIDHLVVRTTVPRTAAALQSLVPVYAGAGWHERETHEMFGIDFTDGPVLAPLLLPDQFEGHPLRKEFVLASRVAKPWPGAKEPGESDQESEASPSRRRTRPPGVPDPEAWGPREPGSPEPDPLGHARPAPARPARPRRARKQADAAPPTDGDGDG